MIAWWGRRTLRFRLAVWYAVGGTLLLTSFTATIYFFVILEQNNLVRLNSNMTVIVS